MKIKNIATNEILKLGRVKNNVAPRRAIWYGSYRELTIDGKLVEAFSNSSSCRWKEYWYMKINGIWMFYEGYLSYEIAESKNSQFIIEEELKPKREVKINFDRQQHFQYSNADCRNSERGKNETNDCTVVALSNATGYSYDFCHEFLEKQAGRQNRKGIRMFNFLLQIPVVGEYRFSQISVRKQKLRTFIREHEHGTYIVLTRGHAQTVKDGKLLDTSIKHGAIVQKVFVMEKNNYETIKDKFN